MKAPVSFCIVSLLLVFSIRGFAEDTGMPDPDLPQPLDPAFADAVVVQSPFTRSVNLDESLQLTGVAYINGRPVATVLNRATKESFLVSEEPNAQGWRLTGLMAGADLTQTQVQLMVGPEVISMHYGGQQLSPGTDGKGNSMSRLAKGGSGKGEKFRASNYLGDGGKEMYAALSSDGRSKFRDLVKAHLEKRPDLTPQQNEAFAKKVYAKIKETDRPSTAAAKTPKPPKAGKKKQGT